MILSKVALYLALLSQYNGDKKKAMDMTEYFIQLAEEREPSWQLESVHRRIESTNERIEYLHKRIDKLHNTNFKLTMALIVIAGVLYNVILYLIIK